MDEDYKPNERSFKDHWAMLGRRRWWLLGSLFLFGWAGFLFAHMWPYLYRSEALILVEQQKVPEQYVTPNVISDVEDRLQSMAQQILSRTQLQQLIERFNLYPKERAHMVMEDVVDKMRKDIQVEPLLARGKPGDLTAFRISYAARSPRMAQQVASELTSLFIEQNLEARTQQSASTTTFLENQLEQARKDLEQQEQRQREYKMRYLGQLPEQQQANLQILSSLEAQLHAASDEQDRAEQTKIYLESMLTERHSLELSLSATGQLAKADDKDGKVSRLVAARTKLIDLQKDLAAAEALYTPQHPDIISLKSEIAKTESLKRRLETEQATAGKSKSGGKPEEPTDDPAMIEVDSRLKAVQAEIRGRQKQVSDLRGRIQEFQSRLNLTPVREQQLSEVTRAYENSRTYYQSLLQKKLQSELATNLEKRQQGEQFRILDPASLPQKPDEPNPAEIIAIGWILGLCLGIAAIVAREAKDESLRSEQEITSTTNLPIVGRIPTLLTRAEETRRKLYRKLEVAGLALLVLLSVSTGVYTFLISSQF